MFDFTLPFWARYLIVAVGAALVIVRVARGR